MPCICDVSHAIDSQSTEQRRSGRTRSGPIPFKLERMEDGLYPLPEFTGGGGIRVPITSASQGILFSMMGRDATEFRLELTRDPYRGGLLAHYGKTLLGRLPEEALDSYPQLGHLLAEGLRPSVGVEVYASQGSGRLHADLLLPAPGLVMPANTPPDEPWALLPEGPRRTLDPQTGEGLDELTRVVPRQFLTRLTIVDAVVVAQVDGRVVGSLSAPDSAAIAPLVSHYQALELVPVGRLYVWKDDGGYLAQLALRAADDATEEDLEPQVNPLPRVSDYHEPTGSFPVVGPQAEGWTVTISGAMVTDELPALTDERLAAIARSKQAAPDASESDAPPAPATHPGLAAYPVRALQSSEPQAPVSEAPETEDATDSAWQTGDPALPAGPAAEPTDRPQLPATQTLPVEERDHRGGAPAWLCGVGILVGVALIATLAFESMAPILKLVLCVLGGIILMVSLFGLLRRSGARR